MTTRWFKTINIVLFFIYVVCLPACVGKTSFSKFYVLSPISRPAPLNAKENNIIIKVSPVVMPDYLDRPQIVTRINENEVEFNEFNRWAEPLKDNFYRVLIENLSTLLKPENIVGAVYSSGVLPTLTVNVEVVRFDGAPGKDVILIAKWQLLDGKNKKLIVAKRSYFKKHVGASTYKALVASLSEAVADLSYEIFQTVKTRQNKYF